MIIFCRGPPYKHALLNFAWFLILAIEQKESITAFSTLVELYKPSLKRYPFIFKINFQNKLYLSIFFFQGSVIFRVRR